LILTLQLILFYDALSCLISSFSSLISIISGLITLYILAFISDILGILDILPISIAGITLGDNLVVEENTELPELARNSYISSLSSSVFCRFYGIIDCSEASISIEDDFGFSLFCLFCLFYSTFYVRVGVASSNANSSLSSAYNLF
jgi:ABC-type anion transport system duplicated permease subunit